MAHKESPMPSSSTFRLAASLSYILYISHLATSFEIKETSEEQVQDNLTKTLKYTCL